MAGVGGRALHARQPRTITSPTGDQCSPLHGKRKFAAHPCLPCLRGGGPTKSARRGSLGESPSHKTSFVTAPFSQGGQGQVRLWRAVEDAGSYERDAPTCLPLWGRWQKSLIFAGEGKEYPPSQSACSADSSPPKGASQVGWSEQPGGLPRQSADWLAMTLIICHREGAKRYGNPPGFPGQPIPSPRGSEPFIFRRFL